MIGGIAAWTSTHKACMILIGQTCLLARRSRLLARVGAESVVANGVTLVPRSGSCLVFSVLACIWVKTVNVRRMLTTVY
jgi:hypothetical protein